MADLAVLEIPKRKANARPKRRSPRGLGSLWQPTYKVTLPDGSKEKRKSNYYWIAYHDGSGKRVSENSNCTTKEGARDILKDRLAKISTGTFTDFQRYKDVTLKQIADDLRTQYVTKGRRSTKKLELSLTRLEEFFGTDCPVSSMTIDRIESYRAARMADEAKPSAPTVTRELAALKAALRLGYKHDKVNRVPHIEMPDEREHIEEGEFSPEQIAALLKELPAHMVPLIRFLYRTGMRVREALGLKWTEVRLDVCALRLSGRRTKNKEAKPLTLDGELLEIIKGQRGDLKKPLQSEWVFPNARGEQLTYDQAYGPFQAACKRAEIKDGFTTWDGKARTPSFHDLRRTFAREADRCGVPHADIRRIGGWKTQAMLERYLGANEDRMRRAFALMDASFGKRTK
jgi:integrase